MSTSTHPIIILSDSNVEDAFSSTNYTSASPDYSPASPRNTSSDSKSESDPSEDQSEDHEFPLERIEQIEYGIEGLVDGRIKHDDEIVLSRVRISTLEILIEDIQMKDDRNTNIMAMINAQDIEHIILPTPPRDTDPPVGSHIPSSPSSSIGFSSPVRSTTPTDQQSL
ncbi:hypothetical protein Tco_1380000 [Tanacetum coccineum]